jgi:hypothetical protein
MIKFDNNFCCDKPINMEAKQTICVGKLTV